MNGIGMLKAVTMAKGSADVTPERLRQLSQRCCRLAENSVEPPALWSVALQLAMLAEVIGIDFQTEARPAITCHPLFGQSRHGGS